MIMALFVCVVLFLICCLVGVLLWGFFKGARTPDDAIACALGAAGCVGLAAALICYVLQHPQLFRDF